MASPHGFFQDSNGDYSMSRLNQFLAVSGGLILAGMALYYDRMGADIIYGSVALTAGAVGWNNRTQEAKENIVSQTQPVDNTNIDVKA